MSAHWRYLDAPPALPGLFVQAALRRKVSGTQLPDQGLRCWVSVDPDKVNAFSKVCGFVPSSLLPPTYPHVLAFPLQMKLLTDKDFPQIYPLDDGGVFALRLDAVVPPTVGGNAVAIGMA